MGNIIVGIDLGTTKSVISYVNADGKPEIIPNLEGGRTTPSYAALKRTKDKATGEVKKEWVVGAAAKNGAILNPRDTLYGVKRIIGTRHDADRVAKMQELASYKITKGPQGDAWVEVDGQAMAPVEISAKVLRKLKEAAEKRLGQEVTQAVITVPAYFDDAQRQATRDAGKIAGLEVLRIVNEPTAAALAYGLDKKKGGKIAVYDLGGGTFDLSILEVMVDDEGNAAFRSLATNGDTFLGGENFDERISHHLIKKFEEEHDIDLDETDAASGLKKNAGQLQRIREAAEKAKIELSSSETATINLPFFMPAADGSMINFEYTLTRKEMEDLLEDLIAKTIPPFKKSLEDAGLTLADIDEVLMVGAQTRMPKVIDVVRKFSGKEPRRDVTPDEIVAMGAAVQAAILDGKIDNVILSDVIPLSIGIRMAGDEMDVIVPRNSAIPCDFTSGPYTTARDNQPNVAIKVYQGERAKCADNRFLGEVLLELPPAKAKEPQIEITLNVDANAVVSVSAKDLKTGRSVKATLKSNGGLSKDDVARMLKDAEANAEKDRLFREAQTVAASADYEVKTGIAGERDKEWYTGASAELRDQFEKAAKSLTDAHAKKDIAGMKAGLEAVSAARTALGEAFSAAASQQSAPEATPPAPGVQNTPPAAGPAPV